MFNKFKSKREEAKYEEMYKGTSEELYEEDLDKVTTHNNIEEDIIINDDDELSLEDLDNIKAGYPQTNENENGRSR